MYIYIYIYLYTALCVLHAEHFIDYAKNQEICVCMKRNNITCKHQINLTCY